MSHCTIVWFRRDLRLSDHAPLERAARRGRVIPVFIFDRALLHHPETAPARVAFMLECLRSLDAELRDRGGRLILRYGDPVTVLPQLIRDTQADGIYAHVDFERLYGRIRDARLNSALAEQNLKIRWFESAGTTAELMTTRQYRHLSLFCHSSWIKIYKLYCTMVSLLYHFLAVLLRKRDRIRLVEFTSPKVTEEGYGSTR